MFGLVQRLFRKVSELRGVAARLQVVEAELAAVAAVAHQAQKANERLDAYLASLAVSDDLFQEFAEWKQRTPVPAEPLVSVCVGTYNRAELLTSRCLPSILKQTYQNLEVIVVGDGCTDATMELIGKIADPRLRFVNLHERGVYPTDSYLRWMVAGTQSVNAALALATGDYVTHLDDDDEFLPERVAKLVGFAARQGCDFVWHPFWFETASGDWLLNEAREFAFAQVSTSSVFYRSWLKTITWDANAYRWRDPGDWHRFRRIKYLRPTALRYPEPLLRHYKERNQPMAPTVARMET